MDLACHLTKKSGGGLFDKIFFRPNERWCAGCDKVGTRRADTGWRGVKCNMPKCSKPIQKGDIFMVGWGWNALYHKECYKEAKRQTEERKFKEWLKGYNKWKEKK